MVVLSSNGREITVEKRGQRMSFSFHRPLPLKRVTDHFWERMAGISQTRRPPNAVSESDSDEEIEAEFVRHKELAGDPRRIGSRFPQKPKKRTRRKIVCSQKPTAESNSALDFEVTGQLVVGRSVTGLRPTPMEHFQGQERPMTTLPVTCPPAKASLVETRKENTLQDYLQQRQAKYDLTREEVRELARTMTALRERRKRACEYQKTPEWTKNMYRASTATACTRNVTCLSKHMRIRDY